MNENDGLDTHWSTMNEIYTNMWSVNEDTFIYSYKYISFTAGVLFSFTCVVLKLDNP